MIIFLIFLLIQLNMNIFLQSIGLTIVQAIFQAPIYGLAVYWGIMIANRRSNNQLDRIFNSKFKEMENK